MRLMSTHSLPISQTHLCNCELIAFFHKVRTIEPMGISKVFLFFCFLELFCLFTDIYIQNSSESFLVTDLHAWA